MVACLDAFLETLAGRFEGKPAVGSGTYLPDFMFQIMPLGGRFEV